MWPSWMRHQQLTVALLLLCPSLYCPTCCQCVWRVFVWRCFDRQCLCVWAVLAGLQVCLVQSWWRAKCSLRVSCAFHSAQPAWTPSRQTAAGGTPLPLLLLLTHIHTECLHPHHTPAFSYPHLPLFLLTSNCPFMFLQRLIFDWLIEKSSFKTSRNSLIQLSYITQKNLTFQSGSRTFVFDNLIEVF